MHDLRDAGQSVKLPSLHLGGVPFHVLWFKHLVEYVFCLRFSSSLLMCFIVL